jgi:hypothetical protein
MRDLMHLLTAQQASLVPSIALRDAEYLTVLYYLYPKSGKRIAHEFEPNELTDCTAAWALAPLECIRTMNASVAKIGERSRLRRYRKSVVDLEILMDRHSWGKDGTDYRGIPEYLMHGYTDMGSQASFPLARMEAWNSF